MGLAFSGGSLGLPDGSPHIVVIVDTSESATDDQAAIRELVSNFLKRLPAAPGRVIHFLGDSGSYPAARFLKEGAGWMAENAGRLSVISPVWAPYEGDEHSVFVVVGSGPIYDLADWEGSLFLLRSHFVSVGRPMAEGMRGAKEVGAASVGDIASMVLDPVAEVSISGNGFLPTWWDNDAYSLRFSDDMQLVSSSPSPVLSVELAFVTADAESVVAEITRRSGAITSERLDPSTPPGALPSVSLPDDEAALWRKAVAGEALMCPLCDEVHVVKNLRCRSIRDSVNKTILRSLEGINDRFVVVTDRGFEVVVEQVPRPVLPLPGDRALVRESTGTSVMAFDGRGGWRRVGQAEPYYEVEAGSHAVFL